MESERKKKSQAKSPKQKKKMSKKQYLQMYPSEPNPFKITSQEDVFELRDREKKQKAKERERQKKLKIWEKNPQAPYKLLVKTNVKPYKKEANKLIRRGRRPQENIPDFIAKKREMFLMQMSLNTKKGEIKKLEDKAQLKDQALEQAEKMLEDDASKFDKFLKKNDKKAHDAFKEADKEIKDKQEKIEQLKRLSIEQTKIENEISKLNDRLAECKKYKTFLLEVARDGKLIGEEQGAKEHEGNIIDHGGNIIDHQEEASQQELPFSSVDELLDLFSKKEEENLFLIQILQRGEEELDHLRRRYQKYKGEMQSKSNEVEGNIKEIESKINYQTSKIDSLKNQLARDLDGSKDIMESSMKKLSAKVRQLYETCSDDPESDVLVQLKEIEVKVDSLIDKIIGIPPANRKLLALQKSEERRAKDRIIKIAAKDRANAERAEKAKARATAETFKMVGKKLMPRVTFTKYKKKKEKKDEIADEGKLEYVKYFTDSAMT